MKDRQHLGERRDALLAECKTNNIKVERKGKTIKQQIKYLESLIGKKVTAPVVIPAAVTPAVTATTVPPVVK